MLQNDKPMDVPPLRLMESHRAGDVVPFSSGLVSYLAPYLYLQSSPHRTILMPWGK